VILTKRYNPADHPTTRIIRGHVLDVLRTVADGSVHCVVTSPPYWGLRDYELQPQVWRNSALGIKERNMKTKTESPAMQLLRLVWEHVQEATGHSWLRLNQAMRSAIFLAVEAGMRFGPDDLTDANLCGFRPGYWFDGEMFYGRAVAYRNASAWQAYEKAHGRKPFIIKGAKLPDAHNYGAGRMDGDLPRLVIGAEFQWKGEKLSVTSFNDRELCFMACSYTRTPNEFCEKCGRCTSSGTAKLLRRYTITHADIRRANAASRGSVKSAKSADRGSGAENK